MAQARQLVDRVLQGTNQCSRCPIKVSVGKAMRVQQHIKVDMASSHRRIAIIQVSRDRLRREEPVLQSCIIPSTLTSLTSAHLTIRHTVINTIIISKWLGTFPQGTSPLVPT